MDRWQRFDQLPSRGQRNDSPPCGGECYDGRPCRGPSIGQRTDSPPCGGECYEGRPCGGESYEEAPACATRSDSFTSSQQQELQTIACALGQMENELQTMRGKMIRADCAVQNVTELLDLQSRLMEGIGERANQVRSSLRSPSSSVCSSDPGRGSSRCLSSRRRRGRRCKCRPRPRRRSCRRPRPRLRPCFSTRDYSRREDSCPGRGLNSRCSSEEELIGGRRPSSVCLGVRPCVNYAVRCGRVLDECTRQRLGLKLLLAVKRRRRRRVRWLLRRGADADFSLPGGVSALQVAVLQGFPRIVATLLCKGADPLLRTCQGWTPLHTAAYHDDKGSCLEQLLKTCADVDARDSIGRTPLHYAAQSGNIVAVRLLLKAGAIADPKDAAGLTPYQVALTDLTRALLRYAARRGPVLRMCPFRRVAHPCVAPLYSDYRPSGQYVYESRAQRTGAPDCGDECNG